MNYIEIEKNCISRITNIHYNKYYTGVLEQQGLVISKQWISSISKLKDKSIQQVDFNLKTKEVSISKKDKNEYENISSSISNMESVSMIDVSNDGLRWEGDCSNNSPLGYGSLYNNDNELIYRGVMIGDKKECFGIDFYPGFDIIEYIGCYWNNERHGFGVLYDRKGELVYEGDYWFGSSYNQKRNTELHETMRVNNIDDPCVHSLIRELIVDEGCDCGSHVIGSIFMFPYLESIVIEKNALQNLHSLKIHNLPQLKSFKTGDESFYNTTSLSLLSSLIVD